MATPYTKMTGRETPDLETEVVSVEAVHHRIILDATTTDGAHQVRLDSPQLVRRYERTSAAF